MKPKTKTPDEILAIEKACRLTDKTFDFILDEIKPGVTEKQLSLKIRKFINKNHGRLSFRSIVAFGKNASEPHHKSNETKLKNGNIVLLDFGAKFKGYCADMTRTVFMGNASDEQKKIYRTVLNAQKLAIDKLNILISQSPSIPVIDIDRLARDYIISQGYTPMPHGLGHGIGKKVHEKPKLSPKSQPKASQPLAEKAFLKPGMTFTIEPGIYIKNFGGVRIEDTVVLEKSGLRILTKSPKGIIELS